MLFLKWDFSPQFPWLKSTLDHDEIKWQYTFQSASVLNFKASSASWKKKERTPWKLEWHDLRIITRLLANNGRIQALRLHFNRCCSKIALDILSKLHLFVWFLYFTRSFGSSFKNRRWPKFKWLDQLIELNYLFISAQIIWNDWHHLKIFQSKRRYAWNEKCKVTTVRNLFLSLQACIVRHFHRRLLKLSV